MEYNKALNFLKKYGYWFALGFAVVTLVTIVVLAINTRTVTVEDEIFTPVESKVINFTEPLSTTNVIKDYSNTSLQYSNTLKLWQAHKAVDFSAEEGTSVLAVMNGTVTDVTYNYLMGNIVKLDVGNGLVVVYASLSNDVLVKVGDTVERGQVIGYVSNTAKTEVSDGPHLHLEVLLDDEKIDPNLYLDLSKK